MTNSHHESRIFTGADPPNVRLGEQGQTVRTENKCLECGRKLQSGYLCDDHDEVTWAEPPSETVVLVQCTNAKRDEAAEACRLYDESSYFVKQRDYARAASDAWYIQSAEYGLVEPDTVLEPYDTHAGDLDNPEAWAKDIADELVNRHPAEVLTVEILGGKDYADPLTPELEKRGIKAHEPLRGQRIGTRQSTLEKMMTADLEGFE